MKVGGSKLGGTGRVGGNAPAAPRAGGGGFSVQGAAPAGGPAATSRASGVSGVASLDALLALQQLDGPLERRRRAMGRAGRILDVLDDLKVSLLEGELDGGSLSKLMDAVREERAATEEPGLEQVLDEIETRAAVELAKWEVAHAAA